MTKVLLVDDHPMIGAALEMLLRNSDYELAGRARTLGRATGVKFTVAAVALPDSDLDQPVTVVGRAKGMTLVAVQASVLAHLLRTGVADTPRPDGNTLFELRTRLQQGIGFV